jgi:YggT family protein
MSSILVTLIQIYIFVFIGRAILSWFPLRVGGVASSVNGVLVSLTEPLLRPVRRLVPRVGMFDLSFLVVVFGLIILQSVIASS